MPITSRDNNCDIFRFNIIYRRRSLYGEGFHLHAEIDATKMSPK